MSMHMDMPPCLHTPPGIGHNSRDYEIRRAAEEIRSAYLKNNLHENTPAKWRILHVANVSGMSDAAFRQLFTYLAFGNQACNNITVSNKTIGLLLQKGERAIQRTNKELEAGEWISDANHNGPKDPKRVASIPEKVMSAIVFECLGASKMTGVGGSIEVPNVTPLSKKTPLDEVYPRQTCRDTPVKNDDRTYIDNLDSSSVVVGAPERTDPSVLQEEDFVQYHMLYGVWGRKQGGAIPYMPWPRKTTDATLLGAVRGQAAHPIETVIAAVRMTIASMHTRAALGESKQGGGSLMSYFQQEMLGMIKILLKQETEPAQVARGSPPNQHWREEKREYSDSISAAIRKTVQQVKGVT